MNMKNNYIALLLGLVLIAASCQNQTEQKTHFAGKGGNGHWQIGSDEDANVWESFTLALASKNMKMLDSIVDDSVFIEDYSGWTMTGKKEFMESVNQMLSDQNNYMSFDINWIIPTQWVDSAGNRPEDANGGWLISGFNYSYNSGDTLLYEEEEANIHVKNGKIDFIRFYNFRNKRSALVEKSFSIDMSEYSGEFKTVNLSGNFNNWCGDCALMTDEDGDGIYTGTTKVTEGEIEFKFSLDNWGVQEEFEAGSNGTKTTGKYTNRVLTIDNQSDDPHQFKFNQTEK